MIMGKIYRFGTNTPCGRANPIAVLAALKLASLALPSTHSYGYEFQSRAARDKLDSSPSLAIPVRNAG
jgi:hypothetical protein